jgi:hypothetical protein
MKFLNQNSIEIKKQRVGKKIILSALHHHGEMYSNLLIQVSTKLLLNYANVKILDMKEGAFSISIEIKNEV